MHPVLGEHHAGARLPDPEDRVADEVDRLRVELLDRVLLRAALEHRADVVAQELHVVLDLEPARAFSCEVHTHRVGEGDLHVIRRLDDAAIADLVVEHAEEHGLHEPLAGLWRPGRQLDHLERLVVLEQQVLRSDLDAPAALLVDDEHGVADPHADRGDALELGREHERAWLGELVRAIDRFEAGHRDLLRGHDRARARACVIALA